jgi:hypothetical protein
MELLFTSEQEVGTVLGGFEVEAYRLNGEERGDPVKNIQRCLDLVASRVDAKLAAVECPFTLKEVTKSAIILHHQKYGSLNGLSELLWAKHQNYGAAPIKRWGTLGVMIRVDSKWERYKNLEGGIGDTVKEAAKDTLQDIIGYGILGYQLERTSK